MHALRDVRDGADYPADVEPPEDLQHVQLEQVRLGIDAHVGEAIGAGGRLGLVVVFEFVEVAGSVPQVADRPFVVAPLVAHDHANVGLDVLVQVARPSPAMPSSLTFTPSTSTAI